MNIFVLDTYPAFCAAYHCDKHVVKMIVESAQLLSNAHHIHSSIHAKDLYKPTHLKHPCSVWAAESSDNYEWLWNLLFDLLNEYERRYGRTHKTKQLMVTLDKNPCPYGIITPFPQVMPVRYKRAEHEVVTAYRTYYFHEKKFANWRLGAPDWYEKMVGECNQLKT